MENTQRNVMEASAAALVAKPIPPTTTTKNKREKNPTPPPPPPTLLPPPPLPPTQDLKSPKKSPKVPNQVYNPLKESVPKKGKKTQQQLPPN
jgi:hypothetical protein